jgi:hypothetical protein
MFLEFLGFLRAPSLRGYFQKSLKRGARGGTPAFYNRQSFSRGSLNIQRAESGEEIFRQTKQISARVAPPTRRIFVKSPQGGLTEKIPPILRAMNF